MSDYTIRPAAPADLLRVKVLGRLLEKESEAMTPAHLRRLWFGAPLPDAYWLDFIGGKTGFVLLCETTEVVGMAVVQTHGEVAHLQQLVVLSACRGLGYGRALTQAAMDRARALGKTAFTLNVLEANEEARQLYEALGFAPYRTYYTHPLQED